MFSLNKDEICLYLKVFEEKSVIGEENSYWSFQTEGIVEIILTILYISIWNFISQTLRKLVFKMYLIK